MRILCVVCVCVFHVWISACASSAGVDVVDVRFFFKGAHKPLGSPLFLRAQSLLVTGAFSNQLLGGALAAALKFVICVLCVSVCACPCVLVSASTAFWVCVWVRASAYSCGLFYACCVCCVCVSS